MMQIVTASREWSNLERYSENLPVLYPDKMQTARLILVVYCRKRTPLKIFRVVCLSNTISTVEWRSTNFLPCLACTVQLIITVDSSYRDHVITSTHFKHQRLRLYPRRKGSQRRALSEMLLWACISLHSLNYLWSSVWMCNYIWYAMSDVMTYLYLNLNTILHTDRRWQ